MKKQVILFLIIIFNYLSVNAQIQVSLNVDSNPTPEISEWVNRNNLAILTVTNTDPDWEVEYKIKVKMFKDGVLMAETNDNVVSQTLELGTVTFLADEIIPYSAIVFRNNSFQQAVLQTGMLPAGEYSFCLSLIKSNDGAIITTSPMTPLCKPMIMTAYQMPELISPIANVNFDSQLVPTITFNWTPVTPAPPAGLGVKYLIAVSEVNSGQSSTQAFHVNTPIIDEEILIGTQFSWPTDIDAPDELKQYVWSIKPVSNTTNESPFLQGNNGFVPVQTFTITPVDNPTVEDCECDTYNLTQPIVEIIQLEPNVYPRKLSLTNVTQLRDYLINCNSIYHANPQNYKIEATINWDSDHASESILGNNAFEHQYQLNTHNIPQQICVNYTINPVTGVNGGQCIREFCIDTPANLLDLNTNNSSTTEVAVGNTIHAGYNHEFEIKVTEIELDSTNNKYNGKGNVFVGWLGARVAVAFNQITLDVNKNLVTGNILGETYSAPAPVYPKDWGSEIIANNGTANNVASNVANWGNTIVGDVIDWTNDTAGDAVDWVNSTTGTNISAPVIDPLSPIPDGPLTDNSTPVKMPLGVNYASGDQFAMTEIVFRPNLSEFNLVAAKNTPQSWQGPGEDPQLVGFIAKNVKFHPSAVETPPERLELLEDVNVGNMNNNMTFTFISPATHPQGGCYIEWDENGFSQFGIELESTFTRDWLVPSPDDGVSRSKATFVATVQDWDELILTGNLEKSEIVDSQAMTIYAGNISLDMSDTLNPQSLQTANDFPTNYNGENTMLFRGFYMEQLTVGMPDCWQTNTNGVPTISVQNMIINDTGITMVAEAINVAGFRGASVADLIASIDTVHVDIRSSSFHDAYVKGKIGLPVSKADSIQNPLKYNALFTTATQPASFQLTVEPTGPINATLLKGVMELDETSNIVAYVDKNKKTFQSTLNGNFVWDDVKLGPVKHVNMNLDFQGIEMNYNSSLANNKFNFNAGTWAFASPQKFLYNFPVTIEAINFDEKTSTGNQLMHGELNFDVIFNLTKNIGGQTKMAVELAIEDNAGSSGLEKFKPTYIRTGIEDIEIYAHLPAVSIDGTLQFRNDDPVYGNGFKGTLNASFKAPSIGISALAEFGNTNYLNNGATYRYWRVEAAAKFTAGLPFLPGVAFYGFGGGAFKNMEGSLIASSGNTPAHYEFSPKKGNLGFKVEATIGAAANADSFNADVGLNGQFSSTDGLINIGFTGDFYIGGPLTPQPEREKAQVRGSVVADYNFPNKHFTMNVDANVDTDKIKTPTPANLNVDIDGRNNKWHFIFGRPTATNTVDVFGLSLYEYLMFGNNIETPSSFTSAFRTGWASVFNGAQPGGIAESGVDDNAALGKGFAFGIGFKFDQHIEKPVFNGYSVNLDVAAGAELNLSMIQKTGVNCADSSKEFGLNGWRANGSVGFYGSVSAGVSKGSDNWPLLDVRAGGWLIGKFPGPTYVTGEVRGQAKIGHWTSRAHTFNPGQCTDKYCTHTKRNGDLRHTDINGVTGILCRNIRNQCTHLVDNYLLDKSFQSDFEWGTDCNGVGVASTTSTVQGDAVDDQSQKLIKYIHPQPETISYNFPITAPLTIKLGLTPNEVFDAAEQQSNGSVLTRTFKLERTVNLFIDNQDDGTFTNVAGSITSAKRLIKQDNNLGEEVYVVGSNSLVQNQAEITMQATLPPNGTGFNSTPQQQVGLMQMASHGNSGAGIYTNAQLQNQQGQGLVRTVFPPVPPTPGPDTGANYDELPPEEAPIVNALTLNKTYKLVVTATLKEFKNNAWVNALKLDLSALTETKTKFFRTGPRKLITANVTSSVRSNSLGNLTTASSGSGNPSATKNTLNTRTAKISNRNKMILLKNKEILKKETTTKKKATTLKKGNVKKSNTKVKFKKN